MRFLASPTRDHDLSLHARRALLEACRASLLTVARAFESCSHRLALHELTWPKGERSRHALAEALGRCAARCPALRSVSWPRGTLVSVANLPTPANRPRIPGVD